MLEKQFLPFTFALLLPLGVEGGPLQVDFEGAPSAVARMVPIEASTPQVENSLQLTGENPLTGKRALALTVSLAKDGYVQFPLSSGFPEGVLGRLVPGGTMSLPLRLQGGPALSAFIQVVDAHGERFQKIFTVKRDQYETVHLALSPGSFPDQWGGDGNKRMDFPLKSILVGLRGTGAGVLQMDDLSFPMPDTPAGPAVFSFEPGERWDLASIGPGNGAKCAETRIEISEEEKSAGSHSLRLGARLEAGGYVQFPVSKGFPEGILGGLGGEHAMEFSMFQKGDLKLFVQVVDATGEIFQVVLSPGAGAWKKIRLPLVPSRFPDIWAGDKDRQITRPLREIRIGLRESGSGSVFIDPLAFPRNQE